MVVTISTLSAIGSNICPINVDCLYVLAKNPSRKSVTQQNIKINDAKISLICVFVKNKYTITGNRNTREIVRIFGALIIFILPFI